METKLISSVVVVLGSLSFLAGCGGIGTRDCPNGVCAPTCTGDTFASGGSCIAFTACAPGTYLVRAGSPVSDQVCELCPSGSFSKLENSAACTTWSICPAGTFVSNVPSNTSNRACAPCGAGTITTGANQSMCTTADQCPAGTAQTAAGTSISGPVCTPCRDGEYCPGGDVPMVSCGGDKWDDDGDPATACVSKTVCSAGTYAQRPGSATTDRLCVPCTAGTFSSTTNSSLCREWDSCEPGTYVAIVPNAISNRLCVACPPGTYSSDNDQSTCLAANACPAGSVEASPGSATEEVVCAPCDNGEFCAGGSALAKPCTNETWDHDGNPATACVPWTSCRPGSYVFLAATSTRDRECAPCGDGVFADQPNSPQCSDWSDCPTGTYVASPPSALADRTCNACDASSYASQMNASSCLPRSECTSYTTFISAPASSFSDNVCTSCGVRGCAKYCTVDGTCLGCLTDTDCSAGNTCIDSLCSPVICGGPTPYFFETFASANANWWTLDSSWEIGPALPWTGGPVKDGTYVDPTSDHSAGGDNMVAGVALGGNAPPDLMSAMRYLTSASIDISGGAAPVYLEFYHWLNSDSSLAMNNTVEVFDGSGWVSVFQSSQASGAISEKSWQRSVYDVTAYRNPQFMVRFGYVLYSSTVVGVSSWNVDDIRIANAPSCIAGD